MKKKIIKVLFKNGKGLEIAEGRLPDDELTMYGHCNKIIECVEKGEDYRNDGMYFRGKEVTMVILI